MSGSTLRLNPAQLGVGTSTLRLARMSGSVRRMLNSEWHLTRPWDRVKNFGIVYMRTTANICSMQFEWLETNARVSLMIFVLFGGTGRLTGCAHAVGTTTPQMTSQSDWSAYRSTSRKVSKPNKHFAIANNG